MIPTTLAATVVFATIPVGFYTGYRAGVETSDLADVVVELEERDER